MSLGPPFQKNEKTRRKSGFFVFDPGAISIDFGTQNRAPERVPDPEGDPPPFFKMGGLAQK